MDIYELVRGNIKRIREERGLSQEEVAERVGVSQSGVSQIEKGLRPSNPTLQTLVKFADALECDVGEFFYNAQDIELMERVTQYEQAKRKKDPNIIDLLDGSLEAMDPKGKYKRKGES